jgi:SAM-dependent methyltransferase
MSTPDPKEHWEQHYAERDQIWSGRVNARVAEIVTSLTPGTALDLGCGEGGDAVWLAEKGWQVVAVDISDTALKRAAALAESRGVADRVEFAQHDLAASFPAGTFDLISAQFLHSKLPLDRPRILRQAAGVVRPGGTLLIVDHAGPPPWASKLHHEHHFPPADEVVASLGLDEMEWERARVEAAEREAIGPDGEPGTLLDNVMVLRRHAAS